MKILITGGLGYVGGRLAAYLKEVTDSQIVLTTRNKDRELPEWTKDFSVCQLDLCDGESIRKCLEEFQPDTIIHLGATNQGAALRDSKLALEVNVRGTYQLLDFAQKTNVKRFIYFSTFQVYGTLAGDITEQAACHPGNPYSITKRCGEDLVAYFKSCYQMQTLVLRLSNAYGFPVSGDVNAWHLAFNSFSKQCVENGKIVIRSNQYRDFIAMEDVARSVHHFLFIAQDKWRDGVFNLGGGRCLSILDVAKEVARVYQEHKDQGPVPVEVPSKDSGQVMKKPFHYNIDKLKETGFEFKGNMEEEILNTIRMHEALSKEKV